jgi:hypothetical protein
MSPFDLFNYLTHIVIPKSLEINVQRFRCSQSLLIFRLFHVIWKIMKNELGLISTMNNFTAVIFIIIRCLDHLDELK